MMKHQFNFTCTKVNGLDGGRPRATRGGWEQVPWNQVEMGCGSWLRIVFALLTAEQCSSA
eukprot:scaffold256991_cov47-Prasinocladus_malaysianus.AAC.1